MWLCIRRCVPASPRRGHDTHNLSHRVRQTTGHAVGQRKRDLKKKISLTSQQKITGKFGGRYPEVSLDSSYSQTKNQA